MYAISSSSPGDQSIEDIRQFDRMFTMALRTYTIAEATIDMTPSQSHDRRTHSHDRRSPD